MSNNTSYYNNTDQLYSSYSETPEAIFLQQQEMSNEMYTPPPLTPDTMKIRYKQLNNVNSGSPFVWGPAFWFSMHNGAWRYPKSASPFWKSRMKSFIQGIPVMLPCENCADHACAYIESQKHNLDHIVRGKDNLIKFFVDFHNFVNN